MANFDLNTTTLAGRLVADPELKTTASGVPVTSFTIAVNRRRRSKNTERKADFFTVVAWRHHAEFVTRYFKKGSSIFVTGELQTRDWTDKDGIKRYATELVADDIRFVDAKSDRAGADATDTTTYIPDAYTSSSDTNPAFEDITEDDELPF